jgi:hypothetical protein
MIFGMSKKNVFITLGVILAVSAIAYSIYRKRKGLPIVTTPVKIGAGSNQNQGLNRSKTLAKGSEGDEVRELQKMLNQIGAGIEPDGIFGDQTEGALVYFKGINETTLEMFESLPTIQA